MKITVDKYEYAKIIRGCFLCDSCRDCALWEMCNGQDDLVEHIEIEEHKP